MLEKKNKKGPSKEEDPSGSSLDRFVENATAAYSEAETPNVDNEDALVAPLDFSKDEVLLQYINPNRFLILDYKGYRIFRMNWLVSLLASAVLWGLVAFCINKGEDANEEFGKWQSWVTQNFTWLYIGTQNVWAVFLLWLCFSKYGNIKLGKDHEKPKYDDLTWFAMLFACGIGIGLYYYGVSEPIYYYSGYPNLMKPYHMNDDQRGQQALFMTYFHWGLHGWCPYIVVAVLLGLVCFRQDHPLSMRYCFLPLVGEKVVLGVVGDLIDALSICCTTFGVCTSLGLGVQSILAGMNRLDIGNVDPNSVNDKIWVILVITILATCSVLSGLDKGIKYLSVITFVCGNLLLLMMLYFDNTWFQLNVIVQSLGHYLQYIVQVGFETDAFQQLNYEIDPSKTNLLIGSNGESSILNRLRDAGIKTMDNNNPAMYKQSPTEFMDWWTIFYWGWWISWAPFVGMFVAMISRGRTIRNVVIGAFITPTLFIVVWFGCFGGLGIKMQRVAELVLVEDTSTYNPASPDCRMLGYEGGEPTSGKAKELADAGYYPLSCRPYPGHIFDIMDPYEGFNKFMYFLVLIGVILYFITSSDSGSFVDDLISANGHMDPPAIQKVYWCWTEGLTTIALVKAGGAEALTALRAVSIVAGLPYTFAICFMCTAIYRACKLEMGDKDIKNATLWSTEVFDIFSLFDTGGRMGRFASLFKGFAFPFVGIYKAMNRLYGAKERFYPKISAAVFALLWYIGLFLVFVGYGVTGMDVEKNPFKWVNVANFGWILYVAFATLVACLRTELRVASGIYGSTLEDLCTTLTMPGFVVSQLEYQATVEGVSQGEQDLDAMSSAFGNTATSL